MGRGAKFGQIANKYFDFQAMIDSKGGDEEGYAANEKTRMENYDKKQSHMKSMASNEEESYKVIDEFKKEMINVIILNSVFIVDTVQGIQLRQKVSLASSIT